MKTTTTKTPKNKNEKVNLLFEQLDRIERLIKGESPKITRTSKEMWTVDDIARYLGVSVRHVQALMRDPLFPKAVSLPRQTLDAQSKRKRFFIGDIVQYCEHYQEKR